MPRALLACTVRGCGLALEQQERTWTCARGHSFDIARAGYVNLLQPQDRRSVNAGDTDESIDARRRLLSAGIGRTLLDTIADLAARLDLGEDAGCVDLGCGAGDLLGSLGSRRTICGVGIDLSTHAVSQAARTFRNGIWVVANADRRLPILDRSVDLVMSLHGRRNPAECARVLGPRRFALVSVPARDDLIELRGAVQGERTERDRTEAVLAEFGMSFRLISHDTVRERHTLERPALQDLLIGTYRGQRTRAASRIASLTNLDVTLAADLLILQLR